MSNLALYVTIEMVLKSLGDCTNNVRGAIPTFTISNKTSSGLNNTCHFLESIQPWTVTNGSGLLYLKERNKVEASISMVTEPDPIFLCKSKNHVQQSHHWTWICSKKSSSVFFALYIIQLKLRKSVTFNLLRCLPCAHEIKSPTLNIIQNLEDVWLN